jgi:hypothetical protein
MASGRLEFLETRPELTAAAAVVAAVWWAVARLRNGPHAVASVSYEHGHRTWRVVGASAFTALHLVLALRVMPFDAVGKLNLELLGACAGTAFVYWCSIHGRLHEALPPDYPCRRRPWVWWTAAVGTAHAALTVVAVVRVEVWAVGTSQLVALMVVGTVSFCVGAGSAVAVLRFRAPVAAGT